VMSSIKAWHLLVGRAPPPRQVKSRQVKSSQLTDLLVGHAPLRLCESSVSPTGKRRWGCGTRTRGISSRAAVMFMSSQVKSSQVTVDGDEFTNDGRVGANLSSGGARRRQRG
jgi:hypothetical protein